jgi:hypothetical protein
MEASKKKGLSDFSATIQWKNCYKQAAHRKKELIFIIIPKLSS